MAQFNPLKNLGQDHDGLQFLARKARFTDGAYGL
jgi:hypothetical protein